MNERIKELAERAGYNTSPYCRFDREFDKFDIERFAELVAEYAAAKEREACATLCEKAHDDYINDRNNDGYDWPDGRNCADAIRARSKHD